jgi:hypothetical protein
MQLSDAAGTIFFAKNSISIPPRHSEFIDVRHFPAGAYVLTIMANQQQQSIPVAIVR